ncbi:hypothetical protein [Candidatus Enterococcus clewellii]|uniref:Uncharacterized protein n=1 Tax=Candidatus Enterococcus clewellii TaxID=1834193 RepID=A0A242K8G4_9ENTE|nr:hypothetical protein [Enterococcus sp. 9E7_DIV0242]OTP17442.1 hypothetical protein A5888_001580 [Enterococcus sp. 9E7_DIV0242]
MKWNFFIVPDREERLNLNMTVFSIVQEFHFLKKINPELKPIFSDQKEDRYVWEHNGVV